MPARRISDYLDVEDAVVKYANETAGEIADELGFSESTVRRYLKKFGINKEFAEQYYNDVVSGRSDTGIGDFDMGPSDSEKEAAKRVMIDAFYGWALEAKVRGGYKVIRKILENLESQEVSVEDDGTFQLSTNDYSVDNTHRKTLVKLRLPSGQRQIELYFRENKYVG